jgi:hypothetical protein
MYTFRPLSPLAKVLIETLGKDEEASHEEAKITVNPLVSQFASWYEKLRNAMEFREEEVMLRATIERILKRRLLLGGNGASTAQPLVKELLWARYLPSNEVSESAVEHIRESIDLHLALRLQVLQQHKLQENVVNEWIYDLMSSDIQYILNTKREKEIMANFMFHVLKDDVSIIDDTQETKDAQVFIAVRKAFSRDDLAFLHYHLFQQYFGKLTAKTLDYTVKHFLDGYKEIVRELNYPGKDRIYTYVKRRSAVFFILDDILQTDAENLKTILESEEDLQKVVFEACAARYNSIASRVRRAIIRSVIFILLTKVAFAFLVEGTYDRIFYGRILWEDLIVNITIPPLLMIIVGLFIRTPGLDNSKRIFAYITQLLYQENPQLGSKLIAAKNPKHSKTFQFIFNILWLIAFVISFGGMIYILTQLHFNVASQFIFIFFLAIVSFLSYRIALVANVYRVGERQSPLTLLVDFLFMPVIRVGRNLTESIRQVNIFLYLFDFVIETPFKSLFAFFDQWFYYLHSKTEELE